MNVMDPIMDVNTNASILLEVIPVHAESVMNFTQMSADVRMHVEESLTRRMVQSRVPPSQIFTQATRIVSGRSLPHHNGELPSISHILISRATTRQKSKL